jgi:hypothetical protein
MKYAIFIADLPLKLPTKFQFIWLRGFRVSEEKIKM